MAANDYLIVVNTGLFAVFGVTSALIIIVNLVAIISICLTRSLLNVTGYLMITLAGADLAVGLTTAIPLVHAAFSLQLSTVACDIMAFLSSVSWVVSVYTLALLSLDRFMAIARPLSYANDVTGPRCAVAVASVCLFAGLIWVLPLAGVGSYKYNDEEVACYFDVVRHPVQWIAYMAVIFLPATAIIGTSYSAILKISLRQRKQIASATEGGSGDARKKNYKAMRTLLIIAGAFYVAWLPFIVEHIVKAALGKLEYVPEWAEITIYALAVTNSFWNPVIYVSTNATMRRAMLRLLTPCGYHQGTPDASITQGSISELRRGEDEREREPPRDEVTASEKGGKERGTSTDSF